MATIQCGKVTFTNVEAVIFDKDGTLANVEAFLCKLACCRSRLIDARVPGIEALLLDAFGIQKDNAQASSQGYCLNPAGLMAVGSRQENAIAAAAYSAATGRGWAQSLALVQEAFQAADRSSQPKAKQTPLLPGAVPLLQKLTHAGVRLGILSSDSQSNVDDFVVTYELSRYFQIAIGVRENLSKSDPMLLEQVLLKLGTVPGQTLMVGDSQIDIQIAKTAQMLGCIGMTGGWSSKPNLTNATVLVNQLDQIQII